MTRAEPPASESASVPAPPPAASALFGDRLRVVSAYAALLAGDGVAHGHIGPREVDRLWSRHLINSAVLTELLPIGARFADVGSGAGLPGVPMAIRRPDLTAVLIEPMLRRTEFLVRAVDTLELGSQVSVVRGRADDRVVRDTVPGLDWVVARAVAPLDRLVRWCLPLLAPGGRLLALKGESASAELDEHRATVARLGGSAVEVLEVPARVSGSMDSATSESDETTWVVSIQRKSVPRRSGKGRR